MTAILRSVGEDTEQLSALFVALKAYHSRSDVGTMATFYIHTKGGEKALALTSLKKTPLDFRDRIAQFCKAPYAPETRMLRAFAGAVSGSMGMGVLSLPVSKGEDFVRMMAIVSIRTLCTAEKMSGNKVVTVPAPLFEVTGKTGVFLKESLTGAIAGVKCLIGRGLLPKHTKLLNHRIMRRAPDIEVQVDHESSISTPWNLSCWLFFFSPSRKYSLSTGVVLGVRSFFGFWPDIFLTIR